MITLRRAVDFMTILAAAGLVGGLGAIHLEETRFQEKVIQLAEDVREFEQMIKVRAATKDVELNGRGWPITIDPGWFNGQPPRNTLLSPDRPWVDVATPEDAGLVDPRIRIALDEQYASFWYNPYQGIVRARVPLRISDSLTLETYNAVNGTSLASIYRIADDSGDPVAAPTAPATTPTTVADPDEASTEPPTDTLEAVPKDETSSEALDPTKSAEPAAEAPARPVAPAKPSSRPRWKPTGVSGK
jgi:hypothetical protein